MVTKVIGDWNEFIAGLIIGGANSLQIGEVLIQWGLEGTFSGGEATVTYPIAYTTAPTVIPTMANHNSSAVNAHSVGVRSTGTTTFIIENRDIIDSGGGATDVQDGARAVSWIAIGINNA